MIAQRLRQARARPRRTGGLAKGGVQDMGGLFWSGAGNAVALARTLSRVAECKVHILRKCAGPVRKGGPAPHVD